MHFIYRKYSNVFQMLRDHCSIAIRLQAILDKRFSRLWSLALAGVNVPSLIFDLLNLFPTISELYIEDDYFEFESCQFASILIIYKYRFKSSTSKYGIDCLIY